MIKSIKKIAPVVEDILERYPLARDNDRLLLTMVWEYQDEFLGTAFGTYSHFKDKFLSGAYANPESVRRSRASIQRRRPELRGKYYGKRKTTLEQEVRREIKDV